MKQLKLNNNKLKLYPNTSKKYGKGMFNVIKDDYQYIRITEGCINNCSYCRETIENGKEPIYYNIPDIKKNNVRILDMNLIYKDKALDIINYLGEQKVNNKVVYYELVCGIDYRYMSQKIANALKKNRFIKIRFAWDYGLTEQYKITDCIKYLLKAGYKNNEIGCFMLCNYTITYDVCNKKLDLLKVYNIKCLDSYFDNQTMPNVKPIYWSIEQIKQFRKKVRLHNQLVTFKIYPEGDKK